MNEKRKHNEHPSWVKVRYRPSKMIDEVEDFLREYNVHTVCSSALCPNRGQCFNEKAMTFLILGPRCTRQCSFCSVDKSKGEPYTEFERDAQAIFKAVEKFNLRYITLTSPTRDDLPDGGASVYADLINRLKNLPNPPMVEALIPDFDGNWDALNLVLDSKPDVLAHNLETVSRLYYRIRKGADWNRSLEVLKITSNSGRTITKSAFIVGLGETLPELSDALTEARKAGCEIMVVGQYLRPTKTQMPVDRYVTPDEFDLIEETGRQTGFKVMLAAPTYRSSFKAEEAYNLAVKKSI